MREVNEQVDIALKDTEKYLRWRRSCYEAVRVLSHRETLAAWSQYITKITLKNKVMGLSLTPDQEKEKRNEFFLNFYECLRWVLNTLDKNVPKEIEKLRMDMYDYKNLYLEALYILKQELINFKELKGRDDVVDVIKATINLLITKI